MLLFITICHQLACLLGLIVVRTICDNYGTAEKCVRTVIRRGVVVASDSRILMDDIGAISSASDKSK